MDKKLLEAFNRQINREFYSGYMYLAMAAYFESAELPGAARWMKLQATEECGHAMKLFDFVGDRGGKVVLGDVEQPPADFASAVDVFEKTLAHEKQVSRMIDNLYRVAGEVGDSAAAIFLHWFITEQVEEEKTAAGILSTLKKIASDSAALVMFDQQLGARQPAAAASQAE